MYTLFFGGLALFLYSIQRLSTVLEDTFSKTAEKVIDRYTRNLFLSIVIGTVATIILDSSSAVIILTIVLVNAKVLTFKKTMGIVMGANIGTTVSSQIIALEITQYSVVLLVTGLIIQFVSSKKEIIRIGNIMLFLGLLFFSLFIMEDAVLPLKDSALFTGWMERAGNNAWLGAGIGGLTTLLIQSSSATVGIAIVLAKQNLISISAGLAVMIGAELGTCSDTLLATIKGSRQALKTGVFHLVFNLISVLVGLLLFDQFVTLVDWISGSGLSRQLANGHVVFNVLGVLLMLPFIGVFERVLEALIPERSIKQKAGSA